MEEKYHDRGCGVQCVAYISRKSPAQIRKMVEGNYIDGREIISVLKKLGFKTKTPFRTTVFEGNKYIAITPSLNSVGEFHYCVIWWGKKGANIYDPIKSDKQKRYVSRNKKTPKPNETIITSWTSLIEVIPQ